MSRVTNSARVHSQRGTRSGRLRAWLAGPAAAIALVILLSSNVLAVAPVWSHLSPADKPGPRTSAAMGYDPSTQQLILYGGFVVDTGAVSAEDTWNWDGSDWHELTPATSPGPRAYASIAYHAARHQLILFGGMDVGTNTANDDTWKWTGSDWHRVTTTRAPSPRWGAQMAYDGDTRQLILFGGVEVTTGHTLHDTWKWTGSNWVKLTPHVHPPDRVSGGMAYDAATKQLLLFGGYRDGEEFGDTWKWTGTNWVKLKPANHPSAREASGFAYDGTSHKIVLFGGLNRDSNTMYSDCWKWIGSNWVKLSLHPKPSARRAPGVAYDADTQQLVMFGGASPPNVRLDETWVYAAP